MKVGDTIRIKKTDIIGVIIDVDKNDNKCYTVDFGALSLPAIKMYENEIERFETEREP